jgi:saccharopine dehydrogenase (NAD+, L-lysine-forming)
MNQSVTFGIIGGYGATGRIVAAELAKSDHGKILIGGRNLAAAQALAAELPGRVSAAHLDILNDQSLNDFCRRCSIVVNCAGPVMVLQDRVAQAAFRNRCHYIDASCMSAVKERMLAHSREIEDRGLSYVISAGWMPGISELVPAYAHAQARTRMDAVESLTVYFGDSGKWSDNALRDGVAYIRQKGLRSAGYFRKGVWTRSKTAEAFRTVDLGDPIGSRRFAQFFTDELSEIGRQLVDCDVRIYAYLSGFRTIVASALIALAPLPEGTAIGMLRNVFRRNRMPVDGFVAAHVEGRCQGQPAILTAKVVFRNCRDYWTNGIVLATVARLIAEGKGVRAGVQFLAGAVDPVAFAAELLKVGVELSDSWTTGRPELERGNTRNDPESLSRRNR